MSDQDAARLAAIERREDSRGLSIDMLDVDRLRQWSEHFDTFGANVTHWASVSFMVEQLRGLAGRLEEAVRDVGALRADLAAAREERDAERDAHAICSRGQQLIIDKLNETEHARSKVVTALTESESAQARLLQALEDLIAHCRLEAGRDAEYDDDGQPCDQGWPVRQAYNDVFDRLGKAVADAHRADPLAGQETT